MNNTHWKDNEVVLAYDSKFDLLESARKEYEQAVNSILEGIQNVLKQYPLDLADELNVEFIVRNNQGFARQYLECGLKAGDDESRIQIIIRVSTAWENEPGHLHLAVASMLGNKLTSLSIEKLQKRSREDELWPSSENFRPLESNCLESNWIYGEQLLLTSPSLIDIASERAVLLVKGATELVLEIDADIRTTVQATKILDRCRHKLNKTTLPLNYVVRAKVGDWQGMKYIQIDSKGLPGLWVGYHMAFRTLIYGHNKFQDCEGFAEKFSSIVGCETESYGGYPSGTLMDMDTWQNSSYDDRMQHVVSAFHSFMETVGKCTQA